MKQHSRGILNACHLGESGPNKVCCLHCWPLRYTFVQTVKASVKVHQQQSFSEPLIPE